MFDGNMNAIQYLVSSIFFTLKCCALQLNML